MQGICSKCVIEFQEFMIWCLCQLLHSNRTQTPLSPDARKEPFLHLIVWEREFLHSRFIGCCIANHIQLLLVLTQDGVIPISHKEAFPLPFFLAFNKHFETIILIHHREDGACSLHFNICSIVKEEILKQLICRLWHRSLRYHLRQRIKGG